jgi:hypothetical protein
VAVAYACRPLVLLHLLSNAAKPLAAAIVAAASGEVALHQVSGDLPQLLIVAATVIVCYATTLVLLDRGTLVTNVRTMVQAVRSRDVVGA